MTKICIFDLDGTLARTQASIARPVNMTLAHFGLPEQPVEAFNYYAGDGIKNALKRALADAGDPEGKYLEEGIVMCRKWMDEDPLYLVEPYDHVIESLHALKENGIIITVFSNKPHNSAVNVVETIFGKGMFDYIQGQNDRIPIKPDPSGVFEILAKYGISAEECLYFGDTNTDMLTAHNAGVTAVGVSWGFRPRAELEAYKADIIIDDPAEIAGLAINSRKDRCEGDRCEGKQDHRRRVCVSADAEPALVEWLEAEGCEVSFVETEGIVSEPLSNHPDIFMCRLGVSEDSELVVCEESRREILGPVYPDDIKFNAACTGKYFIHNLKFTAPELAKAAEEHGMIMVDVKQGYAKCSTVTVDEDSIITYDHGIAEKCRSLGMNVLEISPKNILLPGYDTGFIGGTSGRIGDTVVFNGNLAAHPDFDAIKSFIESKDLALKWFEGWPLTDIGSII